MTTKIIQTLADSRDEKRAADARAEYNDALRARIERDRQEYIQARLREYPQIGVLNSGKFYAYVGGYSQTNYVEGYFLTKIIDAINSAK
jgi:hypothetical protein